MDQHISEAVQLTDEVLISRILSGEKKLFEQIMRSYNQRLYRMGMSILNIAAEVEDAMQNTYINAYLHLSQFENRSLFSTWLTRIMLNECLAQKKKKLNPAMEKQSGDQNGNTPATALANKELSVVLENAVGRLHEKYRLVFVLREIEDLTVKQTAEILSIEESNVKARLSRAKAMLRENLSGYLKDQLYPFHLSRCDLMVANVFSRLDL